MRHMSRTNFMDDARRRSLSFIVEERRQFLKDHPRLKFTFETSAMGTLLQTPSTQNERDLLGNMTLVERLPSATFDEGFNILKFHAIEMGRKVSSYKDGSGKYFVEFEPTQP